MLSPTGRSPRSRCAAPARAALAPAFYDRETAAVARELLGHHLLVRQPRGGWWAARIVETEAYLGPHDPASHSAAGCTPRTAHMHGPAGTAYVYRIYGMHWCLNAVTEAVGVGAAALIRAVEPLGVPGAMWARRPAASRETDLTNGPGKLCAALGISLRHSGTSLQDGPVRIIEGEPVPDAAVRVSPRIGISKAADWPLRFFLASPFVSRTPRAFPVTGLP